VRALILAAGQGTRLHGRFGAIPKCLLRLGGLTLLERQIASVRLAGISEITVVAGYQAALVTEVCRGRAEVVENHRFAETNSLYSLWLARGLLREGFVVLNGDVVFHTQLLHDLLWARHDDALLVAFRDAAAAPFGDEEMKVKVRGGRVIDIAKNLPLAETDGENVGIARFSAAGAGLLVELMDRLVADGCLREWAPRAFKAFAASRPLQAVGTRGFPWIEIDFPDDYLAAARDVLPLLEGDTPEEAGATLAPPLPSAGESSADWRPQHGHV
jgi:choline kinase